MIWRHAKRVVIAVIGGTVVLFGVVLIVTPGPAFVVIPIGLAILATEFGWAHHWLKKLKETGAQAVDKVRGKSGQPTGNAQSGQTDKPAEASAKLAGMQPLIVTLDGPAGSGKSTVARLLARRLGVEFLDTGAMYRGLTAMCVDKGVDPGTDRAAAVALARGADVRFDWKVDPPALLVDGHDLTERLRDPDVTSRVSDLAGIGPIREVLVAAQRRIGQQHPRLVTEGRDQGSVVFPDAQVKFYLDAAPGVRARRRSAQLREAGKPVDEAQLLKQIVDRDQRDSTRDDGPLVCPDDAIRMDTSDLSLDGVVDRLESLVRQQVAVDADSHCTEAGHKQ
jgi:cytidylate kinase